MKEYYVVSDCHSFYTPLITSLSHAGFDKNNDDHILIVLGDVFDRGNETIELYNFFRSIPQERLILIRGNHDDLFEELLEKDYPESYDFHNGTVKTFCQIAKAKELNEYDELFYGISPCLNWWKEIAEKVRNSEIYTWMHSNNWKNYYELDNYIFVHSFIPLSVKPEKIKEYSIYNTNPNLYEYMNDWRNLATPENWINARWGCPWKLFKSHLFDDEIANNKILVCGHWHTSDFHERFEKDYINESGRKIHQHNNFSIYRGNNLIAIDGCIALTHTQNVLIIKNNQLFDQNNKLL